MNTPRYKCPHCGDGDCLMAVVPVSLALVQYDGRPRLEHDENGPHSLSEATLIYCTECYHEGPLSAFDTLPPVIRSAVTYGPYECPQCHSTDQTVYQESALDVERLPCQACQPIDTFVAFNTAHNPTT